MLKLLNTPPWDKTFAVACSGGLDSMVALDFVLRGRRKPSVIFFDHGIPEDQPGLEVVKRACTDHKLDLLQFEISRHREHGESREEFWRKERYKILYNVNMPVLTGHHLNDVMETWIFSALNGMPKLIPYNTNNIYRPFMLNYKEDMKEWAVKHNVEWHEDELNKDVSFARCRIRHNIMPEALKVNAGLGTVLAKLLKNKENNHGC